MESKSTTLLGYSIESLPPDNPSAYVNSPRSLSACVSEGIDPRDLIYKPFEAFDDGVTSQDILSIRFNFYESRRHDLINIVKNRRNEQITTDQSTSKKSYPDLTGVQIELTEKMKPLHLDEYETPLSYDIFRENFIADRANQLALTGGTIGGLENRKTLKLKANEKRWLENYLSAQMKLLQTASDNHERLLKETKESEQKAIQDESDRQRKLNLQKLREDEERLRVEKAHREQERRDMAIAFAKERAMVARAKEEERALAEYRHLKSIEEAERRIQKQKERERAEEDAWRRKAMKLNQMRFADEQRQHMIEERRQESIAYVRDQNRSRRDRWESTMRSLESANSAQNMAQQAKNEHNARRDEKVELARLEHKRLLAKRIEENEQKRQYFFMRAQEQFHDKRNRFIGHLESNENKAMNRKMELDQMNKLKSEINRLKRVNKELQISRHESQLKSKQNEQKMLNDFKRLKMEKINEARQQHWKTRRDMSRSSYDLRQLVKNTIHEQRLKSQFNLGQVSSIVNRGLSGNPQFNPTPQETIIADTMTEEFKRVALT